jgi:hypothetical protein
LTALGSGIRHPLAGDDRTFSMADSAVTTQSSTPGASSTKRRANTVSTETENKLARAARSAQRLAQLSDASRDDSTLDLFPDDPTRATLEAMNIDIRQGTLHGFELPDVVLAAVGAGASGDGLAAASSEGRTARRATRERSEASAAAPLAGFERVEPTSFSAIAQDGALFAAEPVAHASAETLDLSASREPMLPQSEVEPVPMTPAMAAATVARSVTALRHASETDSNATAKAGGLPPQRFAATFAKAATASRDTSTGVAADGDSMEREVVMASGVVSTDLDGVDELTGFKVDSASSVLMASTAATLATAATLVTASTASTTSAELAGSASSAARNAKRSTPEAATAAAIGTPAASATLRSGAPFAAPMHDAARTTPELDRARATAFADTVDALYGVISDQRRAATDHSRRMKWMLSIVVAALLVTVAIGVTQTILLMRLTRETTAQQHRTEEMMQNQQAAMTSLLDAHLATSNAATGAPSEPNPAPAAPAPVSPRQTPAVAPVATTPAGKRIAKTHAHPHKQKVAAVTTR